MRQRTIPIASRWVLGALLLAWGGLVRPLVAQDANVETVARILAAEDARRFDAGVLRLALADPDSMVRRVAAQSVGRLRDPRGIPLLAPLLRDPDSLTQTVVIFALGLIGDTGAVAPLLDRARDASPLSEPAALEMVTAMARLGTPEGVAFLRSVLDGSATSGRSDQPYLAIRAALEAWRLGRNAPINELLGLLSDQREDARYAAVYSLGRLRARAAATRMLDALSDRTAPQVRATAARTLSKAYADSAGLDAENVADLLLRGTNDADPGVRINALVSLGTYRLPRLSPRVLPVVEDPVSNVQVQAVRTLGQTGGAEAVTELSRIATSPKGTFARRREALLALSGLDSTAFAAAAVSWEAAGDWRQRAAAATGAAHWGSPQRFLQDRDPRVVATALQAWGDEVSGPEPVILEAARRLLGSPDAAVRTIAAGLTSRAASLADAPDLVAAYRRAQRDSFPDAAIAALGALNMIGGASPAARSTVDHEILGSLDPPKDYVIRHWAEENWPAAASTWGGAFPLVTGRTMEDYRAIARQYLVGYAPGRYPVVKVEVDQLGTFELELFGPEAPLTVANFLRLMNRRYFDGMRFHRVVPNFVAQTGDPRGDGWGGPAGPFVTRSIVAVTSGTPWAWRSRAQTLEAASGSSPSVSSPIWMAATPSSAASAMGCRWCSASLREIAFAPFAPESMGAAGGSAGVDARRGGAAHRAVLPGRRKQDSISPTRLAGAQGAAGRRVLLPRGSRPGSGGAGLGRRKL